MTFVVFLANVGKGSFSGRQPEPQESQGLEAALSQAWPLFRLGSGNSTAEGGLWRLRFSRAP